jgi:hypothetical protein
MKNTTLFLIFILLCSSCATIFNKKTTTIKLSSDNESKIIYDKDTLHIYKKPIKIKPKRSDKTLKITVLKDSLKKDFLLEKKISPLFWANLINIYGLGMLVDITNDKRFTYKHNLHFVTDSTTNTIEINKKKVTFLPKNSFFIYTSPLQFLDFFNEPMSTLGIEYSLMKNISLSAEYGFRNSVFQNQPHSIEFLDEKARVFRLETKWYNGINFINNVHLDEYLGLEYREIKSQYNDNLNYTNRISINQINSIRDDFATVKTVGIINLKYGILVPLSKTFYFDFYSGFGVRVKKFNHINLEYNKEIHQLNFSDDLSFFDTNDFKNYNKKAFLNYSLGFKFGIKL